MTSISKQTSESSIFIDEPSTPEEANQSEQEFAVEDELETKKSIDADYGHPFESRSFGGEFVWAQGSGYTAKILHVRPKEIVAISSAQRKDLVIMLTGGRAILERRDIQPIEGKELQPGEPVTIDSGPVYRLVALTDVELFTVYSPE